MSERSPGCLRVGARLRAGIDFGRLEAEEGRHLAACGSCRALLERVRTGLEELGAGLSARGPSLSEDEALALARGAGVPRAGAPASGRSARASEGAPTWRVAARVALPAAALAAAALAAVWAGWWQGAHPAGTGAESTPAGVEETPPGALGTVTLPGHARAPGPIREGTGFSVDVPESGRVAVFATADPEIRVVWFY